MLLSIGLLWIFAITVLVYQSVFFFQFLNRKYHLMLGIINILSCNRKCISFFLLSWNISPLIFFLSLSRLLTVAIFFVLIMLINDVYILDLDKNHTPLPLQLLTSSRGTQRQFLENICSEDDLRSRIFATFFVKFLACLPLLGFSNI